MTPRSLSWSSVLWLIGRLSACALAAVLGLLAMPSVNQAADDKPAAKAKEEKQAWIPDRREFVAHIVRIDADKGILSVDLSEAELAQRRRAWKPRRHDYQSGALWRYAQTVGDAEKGAVTHPGARAETHVYADI